MPELGGNGACGAKFLRAAVTGDCFSVRDTCDWLMGTLFGASESSKLGENMENRRSSFCMVNLLDDFSGLHVCSTFLEGKEKSCHTHLI